MKDLLMKVFCYNWLMLVSLKNSSYNFPIGIAVRQWEDGGKKWFYAIYPFNNGYCSVEITNEDEVTFLSTPANGWSTLNNENNNNLSGHKTTDKIDVDLYSVWDDGAGVHKEASVRIFENFKDLINSYTPRINELLKERGDKEATEAIKNGWESI
jgi:hypothetical protein